MARRAFIAFCLAGLAWSVQAEPACRVAFDMGSSGIRAGADVVKAAPRAEIDVLADVAADGRIDSTVDDTVAALRALPAEGGFPVACVRVGGGFSAWRLALRQGGGARVADLLADIRARSGVALLVIPQEVEGRYGHVAARKALGPALRTRHVLDIGGGSLQVAAADAGRGVELGQKSWNELLCDWLRGRAGRCALEALDEPALRRARALAAQRLAGLAALNADDGLTAISRPVTRGVHPALQALVRSGHLAPALVRDDGFDAAAPSAALALLAPLDLARRQELSGLGRNFVSFLVSDLLLVEGILRATGAPRVASIEASITNLPGLLDDARAFAWAEHHDCYLARLRELGEAAYSADPARCAAP